MAEIQYPVVWVDETAQSSMAVFLLKKFTRRYPNSAVGELVREWIIEADSNLVAVRTAKRKLEEAGFRPPSDFAILRDATGKKIWDYVVPWDEFEMMR